MKTRIKPVATKRQAQLRAYDRVRNEIETELKASGKWMCFFSGLPLHEDAVFHHLIGRENELLTDKKFLVPVLHEYHQRYHDVPFSKLKNEWWWDGFMKRLKEKDENLWYNHKLRSER